MLMYLTDQCCYDMYSLYSLESSRWVNKAAECRDGMVGLECFQLYVIIQKRKQSSFYLISTSYQKMKYFSIDNFTDFEYYLNIQKNEESHHCLNNSSVVSL